MKFLPYINELTSILWERVKIARRVNFARRYLCTKKILLQGSILHESRKKIKRQTNKKTKKKQVTDRG